MDPEVQAEESAAGVVTHAEARQIANRYNASHFAHHQDLGERARYSIPANPKRDDDIRLAAYITRCERIEADRDNLREALAAVVSTMRDVSEIATKVSHHIVQHLAKTMEGR